MDSIEKDTCGVLAIDNGGHTTVVINKYGKEVFPSVKGIYGERNLTKVTAKHDFIVQYLNNTYVAGELAVWDCLYPLQMNTTSKQNEFFDLSVLIAVHQYGYPLSKIVIDVPIKSHTESEKEQLISRLKKSHTITINGVTKTFCIDDVKVSPEGVSSYWVNQEEGKVRWLDLGSRTINWGTSLSINNKCRFIDTESGTFYNMGLTALGSDLSEKGLGDYICGLLLSKWNANDKVYILGGGALNEELVKVIKSYFIKAEVADDPVSLTARGMYKLGVLAYGLD